MRIHIFICLYAYLCYICTYIYTYVYLYAIIHTFAPAHTIDTHKCTHHIRLHARVHILATTHLSANPSTQPRLPTHTHKLAHICTRMLLCAVHVRAYMQQIFRQRDSQLWQEASSRKTRYEQKWGWRRGGDQSVKNSACADLRQAITHALTYTSHVRTHTLTHTHVLTKARAKGKSVAENNGTGRISSE